MAKKLNKNIGLHPWKQINWMACNLELLRLQAKLYNALKLEQENKTIKQHAISKKLQQNADNVL